MAERNPNAGRFVLPSGYTDLGMYAYKHPRVVACGYAKHRTREFDNSLYKFRCTDLITICDECKWVYHVDMSD